ncbi:hypothetical protein FNYG_08740 [Fusarium nygamai]|uniref:Uncharacterized protein n=1 Tax=Gibberella nygamai TaxID=42673 RepID=A0A2K0W6X2_GIBNY|nr:hypothetical protein FNYG_08740 [Fusarium nygamai]
MNPYLPPPATSTSGPQTQGTDTETWRVLAVLRPDRQVFITITPARPDDPPLRDWADFQSINDMQSGTTFHITRQNALSQLDDLMRYVYPDGDEVDVIEQDTDGLVEQAVL